MPKLFYLNQQTSAITTRTTTLLAISINMKDYFKHISLKYNNEASRTMKEYCNETKRLVQQQQRLRFTLACRSYGIIPNHTKNTTTKVKELFKCNTIKGKLGRIENNFHKKILNLEISQTNTNIKLIKQKLFQLKSGIMDMILEEDYNMFFNKQISRMKHITKNIKEGQIAKLNTLKEKTFKLHGLLYNENWFENRTDVVIPTEYKWILSLGKKFALPVDNRSFSPLHVIADVEQCIQAMENNEDKEKDVARTKLATNINNFKRKLKNTPKEKFILTIFEKTKKILKKHDNILILQADKGNKTVMMYKKEYSDKMERLLDDKNTYRTLRTDPTTKLQRENNNIVADLQKHNHIDNWEKRKLYCSAATAPRIYGLPKIHKLGTPLRPIVSSVQVPCYDLSKYVGQVLKNIISDDYNVKNSLQVKKQLENMELDDDEVMVSFDVISLFTNIPVHLAIRNIMKKWDKIKEFTKIPSSKFLKILNFCLIENNYFMYADKLFHQVFGMPMGNPLSPTIADIVLDSLFNDTLAELREENIHFKYITKYVDDILAVIKIKDKDKILNCLNNYHPKIQFTIEVEEKGEIAFLDMKLRKNNNKITFDWFTKETSSGRIINFNATQPKNQIINTAKNLISRVLNISDDKYHTKNISKIEKILKTNSFPNKLVKTLIDNTVKNLKNQNYTQQKTTDDEDKKFYSVKYIPGLTDKNNIKTSIETEKMRFAYKPNTTLSTIFSKTKAPIDKQQQCNIIYKINCSGNDDQKCEQIYIGTTKRTLEKRIGEHQADIKRGKESTALAQHILKTGHTADFKQVEILDKETREKKRLTLESLHIQQNIKKTMNLKEDTNNISASYMIAIS